MIAAAIATLLTLTTDPRLLELNDNVDMIVDGIGDGVDIELVIYVDCDQVNAWYHPVLHVITVCNELANELPGYQRFVIAHEVGHAVIDQYHVPFTGSEEVAADEFAALMMIATGHADDVIDAATYYWTKRHPEDPYDDHAGDVRRGWNLMCLEDGASEDPASMECVRKFQHAVTTWMTLLRPTDLK